MAKHSTSAAGEAGALETVSDLVLALLGARLDQATVCPSEVARALSASNDAEAPGSDWRSAMPMVHAAVDRLVTEGKVQLSWKGQAIATRAGPYRIGRSSSR